MALLLQKCTVSLSKLSPTRHYSLSFQTLLFSSSANVPVPSADFLTTQHHMSPETALKASSTFSHLKKPLRIDSILSCLKETGFSAPQIDLMIRKNPRILNGIPEILKEKLKIFEDKGFSAPDTIAVISENPSILFRISNIRIGQSIDALKATLGSAESVGRVLKKLSWFVNTDLRKTMIPSVEFLKKRSELSSSQVVEYVMQLPKLFLVKPETIENGVRRLDDMGLKWSLKMYPHALWVMCLLPEEKLKLKMRFFQGLGLSENEVLQMFNVYPNLFICSEKNIKEKMEVLLGSGRADSSPLLANMGLLMFSPEKRVKPRLEVIKALEDRGLWPKKHGLSSILQMSNDKFLKTYVLPNSISLGGDLAIRISNKLGGNP